MENVKLTDLESLIFDVVKTDGYVEFDKLVKDFTRHSANAIQDALRGLLKKDLVSFNQMSARYEWTNPSLAFLLEV